jgi:hypothetical protein
MPKSVFATGRAALRPLWRSLFRPTGRTSWTAFWTLRRIAKLDEDIEMLRNVYFWIGLVTLFNGGRCPEEAIDLAEVLDLALLEGATRAETQHRLERVREEIERLPEDTWDRIVARNAWRRTAH